MHPRNALAASALGLAACFCAAPTARAEGPETTQPAAKAIQWIDGWEAGRKAAEQSGKLMLVYVHRTSPT